MKISNDFRARQILRISGRRPMKRLESDRSVRLRFQIFEEIHGGMMVHDGFGDGRPRYRKRHVHGNVIAWRIMVFGLGCDLRQPLTDARRGDFGKPMHTVVMQF
jgi:hypothetical protein